ncbi:hypothetical protein CP975_34765 [Streptomyces alboniger]|uniref:Uncharacterized protein n=1 Tax=Streptomyces alboniger TaxID=132473 RepID=A0A5J6HUH5_STRAD|nr:hypothetical protein CP975_34765 [Streptomyces alboniger]
MLLLSGQSVVNRTALARPQGGGGGSTCGERPLLRAVGIPLSTTAWTDADPYGPGELWKVDQEHFVSQAGSGVSHHRPFVAMLTDPGCGMPLALEHEACRRATSRCDDCRVYLRSHRHPGRLEIRFTRRADFYLERA